MKLFTCGACQQVVFFENVQCTRCGHALAYLPDAAVVSAIEPAGEGEGGAAVFVALAPEAKGARYRLCRNYTEHAACNWTVPADEHEAFCRACRFNELIPNLADAHARDAWRRIERAKRRLFYTLMAFGLPLEEKSRVEGGLAFVFKADDAGSPARVLTGHSDGVITLNIAEADDPFREQMRLQMGEAYRTLLGHFRHEIGHYYWSRLIDGTPLLEPCRALFGDERADYAASLQRHYDEGAPADWGMRFVSSYASMHPWEDWAETWAHYLHMVDTLETARSYGLALRPRAVGGSTLEGVAARRLHFDDFDDLIAAWVPLTLALNSFNRSMGLNDLYPFVLSLKAVEKLRFVHDAIEQAEGHKVQADDASPSEVLPPPPATDTAPGGGPTVVVPA
jgi:hypothetical protein